MISGLGFRVRMMVVDLKVWGAQGWGFRKSFGLQRPGLSGPDGQRFKVCAQSNFQVFGLGASWSRG